MQNYKEVKYYFDHKLNTDLANGYIKHSYSDNNYYISYGQSIDSRDFIVAEGQKILIIDYRGNLKLEFTINTLPEPYNKYIIWDAKQLTETKFICSISNSTDTASNYDSAVVIINYNLITSTIQLEQIFKILPSQNVRSTYNLSPKMHSFLYKNDSHIYLCWDNTQEKEIQGGIRNEIIQEQSSGNVIWEWSLSDHMDLTNYIIRYNNTSPHLNYIEEIDENHLLVSYRNIGLVCINKEQNCIDWAVAEKYNSFDFRVTPVLQHSIEFLNLQKTQFATFNNNWDKFSRKIEEVLANKNQILLSDLAERQTSKINIYDIINGKCIDYDTKIPASPRQGNIIYLGNAIFDINYGMCLLEDSNYIYKVGLLEEKNLKTEELNFCLKFNQSKFYIRRGLY